MKFTGINHLAMVTADMDATIRFWRDLLGMRMIAGLGEAGFRHYFFEIDKHNTIAFFEWEGAKPIEKKLHGIPFKGPIVFDHISFGMESSEETWKLKDTLEDAGIKCSDMIDHGFIHSVYAFDPNGIAIEFSYSVEGRDIHETPFMQDPTPPPAAQEGAEPQPGKWPPLTHRTPLAERVVKAGDGSGFFHPKG